MLAGQCYHRLGDAAAACALLETALADHPNDARLFYVLMDALRDEGRDGAADRRAARLGELVADERDEVGLAEFFNRYDHHGWARLDNKATLAGMVAGCPWQPESFAMPGGFADLETAHERHGGPWIVKPAALFGGQGITVTDDLARVPREDGWLVQRYINDPYLIDGKKFHLRLYVLVTSVAPPEAWLWHDGIVRFAAEVYRVDPEHFAREAMHVTNTVRFQDHPDLVVADDVADDGTGNVWSLDALYRRLEDDGAESPRPALEKLAAGLMAAIEAAGVFADQATVPRRSTAPKLLGLDVLLDSAGRPWLLEVERYPALGGGAAAVVDAVNGRLLKAMVELALETPDQDLGPTAKKCGFTALFSRRPGGVSAA